MEFNSEVFWLGGERSNQKDMPKAWRVVGVVNLTEDDLQTDMLSSGDKKPIREGQPAGGHNFGGNNNTPAANDKNNPSQYAGNTNAYFDRTEPSEEHPENSNFKDERQQGSPDYDKAQPRFVMDDTGPKPERIERGNGENDRPNKGDTSYQEEAGNSQPNIPGPGELPDQQKVGERVDDDDREHIET